MPALGGKFDGNGLFVVKFEQTFGDVALDADTLQGALLSDAAFGDQLDAGVANQTGGEIDQLEVVLKAAQAIGLERRQIVAASADAGIG